LCAEDPNEILKTHLAIPVTDQISIQESDLQEHFVRSSGPGGQNVNKVATAVQLFFDLRRAALPDAVRARLMQIARRRINADDVLVLEAKRFRAQEQNRADARARLLALIRQAATPPKPRRQTQPTRGSKERRLQNKKRRGAIKQTRGAARAFD